MILGEHLSQKFVDVCWGKGDKNKDTLYAVTASGYLCTFNKSRQGGPWLHLKVVFFILFYYYLQLRPIFRQKMDSLYRVQRTLSSVGAQVE
jgi:hypothetical protein